MATYLDATRAARALLAHLDLNEPDQREYARGVVDLLADLFPAPVGDELEAWLAREGDHADA